MAQTAGKAARRINTTFDQRLVGGSDVAAILGMDPWKTSQEVWERFMGLGTERETTWDMERGNEQEDWAIRAFRKLTGLKTRKIKQTLQAQDPWGHATAHIDSHIVNPARLPEGVELGGDVPDMDKLQGPGVLEIKNPRGPGWLKAKREGLNAYYLCQMAHYWGVTGWTWGAFNIHHSDYGPQFYFLERDEELVQDIMSRTKDWYERYVLTETCPPLMEAPVDIKMDAVEGTDLIKDDSPLWRDLVTQLREAKANKQEGKTLCEAAEQLVKDYMKGRDDARVIEGGGGRIYWRPTKGRKGFDKTKLAAWGALDPALVRDILRQNLKGDHLAKLEQWITACKLDMDLFVTEGKPGRPLKPYFFNEG